MPYETDERVAELTERLENGVRELYAATATPNTSPLWRNSTITVLEMPC